MREEKRELVVWMLTTGGTRHPGPARSKGVPGRLTVEFVNVGSWLTHGDLALKSCAQYLAVAAHRLIPARVRSVGHQLRQADAPPSLGTCLPGSHFRWSCRSRCG